MCAMPNIASSWVGRAKENATVVTNSLHDNRLAVIVQNDP